jgi:hypothetical protein
MMEDAKSIALQKGTNRTAQQAHWNTLWNTLWDQRVLGQAIAGMLSGTQKTGRLRECVARDKGFAMRGPVCVALPSFRVVKTDREEQRRAAGFDSALCGPALAHPALEVRKNCAATSHEHRPAKQSMHSGNYQCARPALVDTIARLAHELHRELAQHAKQLRPLCVPSIGGKEGVFLSLYGGVGRVALEEELQGREAAIIGWEDGA